MRNGLFYITAFLIFWSILAERVTTESSLVGLVIAGIIYMYVKDSLEDTQPIKAVKVFPLWIVFLVQLISEIIVANIQVAIIVLSKEMPIGPEVVEYKTKIKSDLLKTILANSITLTPGTMSVDIKEDTMLIHCLSKRYAESLEGNAFEKTLLRIQEAINDE